MTLQCVLLRQCAVWAYVVLSKDENICAASYRLEKMSFFKIGLSHPKIQQPSMCAAVQVFRSWKEEESDATVKDQLLSKQVCDFYSLSFPSIRVMSTAWSGLVAGPSGRHLACSAAV